MKKAVNAKKSTMRGKPSRQPLRFAHPYFTSAAPGARSIKPADGQRMLDHVAQKLGKVPQTTGDGMFGLADVIGKDGTDAITGANQIIIHIAGDTGVPEMDRETRQVMVADTMAKDYQADKPALSPAFFLHLGDVIYGAASDAYLSQFYRPYMHYPGKIIAIPGNHDGESDMKLNAFQEYFCAKQQAIPKIAGSIYRETLNQPGVYWCLDAPYVQIIGLYSNNAENPGAISGGAAGQAQKTWLISTLKTLKKQRATQRKALFFATHHPPYSSGGHSGSTAMLADIDDACNQAGLWPDAFFSGHAHSIQRYTRTVQVDGKSKIIPFIVTGCGGHGGQPVAKVSISDKANPSYDFAREGWGYTKATISSTEVTITSYGVDWNTSVQVDSLTIKL